MADGDQFVRPYIKGRWLPGVSGNPGGRRKNMHQVEELARKHTPAAIAALVEALGDPKTKVPAAVALLDRGWGKPQQRIEQTNGGDHLTLHLVAAKQVSQRVLEGKVVPDPTEIVASRRKGKTIEVEAAVQLDATPPIE